MFKLEMIELEMFKLGNVQIGNEEIFALNGTCRPPYNAAFYPRIHVVRPEIRNSVQKVVYSKDVFVRSFQSVT